MAETVLILFRIMEIIMTDYSKIELSDKVIITCTDDEKIEGIIMSIDDEEESEIGEIGITVATADGRHIMIGESEILDITVIE